MKGIAALLASIAVAMISWGVYGPVLQAGKEGMNGSALRPFICVGLAYFLIAVIAPAALLRINGEAGHWSTGGIIWSLAAGTAGAVVRWALSWRWPSAAARCTSCRWFLAAHRSSTPF